MKLIHVLALLPFIGMLGGLPFVNTVTPYVLGMPFNLFWIILWVVLSSVIMAILNIIDRDHREGDDL
ncbi:DUF3311 domain-containing protein [Peribacillus butanolivorans]|uniref:DUF3311 domain-containing protein n=1 Tax=Peribacillus butanolivorans TaxID=421767 RepID=UPI0030C937E2